MTLGANGSPGTGATSSQAPDKPPVYRTNHTVVQHEATDAACEAMMRKDEHQLREGRPPRAHRQADRRNATGGVHDLESRQRNGAERTHSAHASFAFSGSHDGASCCLPGLVTPVTPVPGVVDGTVVTLGTVPPTGAYRSQTSMKSDR